MQRLIETLAFVSILFTFHILYTHLGQPFNLSLNLQLFSEGSFNFFPTKLSILFCFLTSFLAQMVYQQNSKKISNPTPNSITHLWTLWIFSDRIGKLLCCTSITFKIITVYDKKWWNIQIVTAWKIVALFQIVSSLFQMFQLYWIFFKFSKCSKYMERKGRLESQRLHANSWSVPHFAPDSHGCCQKKFCQVWFLSLISSVTEQ
jgi:hypothetical protein